MEFFLGGLGFFAGSCLVTIQVSFTAKYYTSYNAIFNIQVMSTAEYYSIHMIHKMWQVWQVTFYTNNKIIKKNLSIYFGYFCMGATIHTHLEIECLLSAGFLLYILYSDSTVYWVFHFIKYPTFDSNKYNSDCTDSTITFT